jgi:branched-chain amino acid transport system substrate-binding protein
MLRSDFLASAGATTVAQISPAFPNMTPSVSIALVAPLSGPAKPIGMRLSAGVQACIQYNNELAGSLQRTYAMRPFDDQNTAANALIQSSFATGDSTVVAVIGHLSSDATLQGIQNYGPAQVPLIVPLSTDDRITATQYRNVFRLPTKDSFEGQLFARTVIAQYKPKLSYVFVQDADYGADVANGFLTVMKTQKSDAQYQQFSYDHPDFAAVVDKAMVAQPDYVFLAGVVGDMGPIVGMLRAKGYTGPIGASQGFFDGAALKLGPASDGMMVSTSMPYLPFAPATVRWVQDFQQHWGQMDAFAAFGYAATQIIISAVARTNAGTASGRGALVTAIAQGVPIDTMTGTYSFTPFGDPLQPQIYYYTLKDGKFTYLKQAHPSTFMLK